MKTAERLLGLASSIASLIGLAFILVKGTTAQVNVLLICISVALLSIVIMVYVFFKKLISQYYEKGWLNVSSMVRYSTNDGREYKYEVFKHVQCKKPVASTYEYRFKWSGTKLPEIVSGRQSVTGIARGKDGQWDSAALDLKRVIVYNDIEVIHVQFRMDDTDGKASPYIETRIDAPTQVLTWSIDLRHKSTRPNAIVQRRKLDTDLNAPYESVTEVVFDKKSRSFQYDLINPDVGYVYRIEWVK